MGFFKELKEDISQAVNELLPEDMLLDDFPDMNDEEKEAVTELPELDEEASGEDAEEAKIKELDMEALENVLREGLLASDDKEAAEPFFAAAEESAETSKGSSIKEPFYKGPKAVAEDSGDAKKAVQGTEAKPIPQPSKAAVGAKPAAGTGKPAASAKAPTAVNDSVAVKGGENGKTIKNGADTGDKKRTQESLLSQEAKKAAPGKTALESAQAQSAAQPKPVIQPKGEKNHASKKTAQQVSSREPDKEALRPASATNPESRIAAPAEETAAAKERAAAKAADQQRIAALRKEVLDEWLIKQEAVEQAADIPKQESLFSMEMIAPDGGPHKKGEPEAKKDEERRKERKKGNQKMEDDHMAEMDSILQAAGENDADLIAKLMEEGMKPQEGNQMEDASLIGEETEPGAVLENIEPEDDTTTITKGTRINGSIASGGSIEILGTVTGDVECLGKLSIIGNVTGNCSAAEIFVNTARLEGNLNSKESVKIGAGTIVIGDIKAESAVIAGAVKGELDVNGPVIIDSTAIVKGNIHAKSVQINNGAVVDGYCALTYAAVDIDNFFDEEEK